MALINLRNALMAGKRLPYDAEVEYLESTGTQWIDTEVNADANLFYTIVASATTAGPQRMGAITLSPSIVRHHCSMPESVSIISTFGYGTATPGASGAAGASAHVLSILKESSQYAMYVDGNLVERGNIPTFNLNKNFFLFARNDGASVSAGSMRIYSAKLYVNSTLVRDFIPVRKGTVGYLYDRVSGKLFGNAGTGDFVRGPDVVPVEYIESHGTEYIDTGYLPIATSGVKAVGEFFVLYTRDYSGFFGCRSSGANDRFWAISAAPANTTGIGFGINTTMPKASLNTKYTTEVNYKGSGLGIFTDTVSISGFSGCPYAVYLFGVNISNASRYNGAKRLYLVEITEGVAVVHKYTPIRVGSGSTWEGAMMDVLTRRIYRNAGTGAFAYGNDLKYPIPAS